LTLTNTENIHRLIAVSWDRNNEILKEGIYEDVRNQKEQKELRKMNTQQQEQQQ
jgi:hypothetical protein